MFIGLPKVIDFLEVVHCSAMHCEEQKFDSK